MISKINKFATSLVAILIAAAFAIPSNLQAGTGCKESEDADDDFIPDDDLDPYGAALSRSIASSAGMQGRFLAETGADDLDILMEESILGINHGEEASEDEDLFEGDILLPRNSLSRSGLISESSRWPNNTIVYTISEEYKPKERTLIKQALKVINSRTGGCIKFRKATIADKAYLFIRKQGKGCSSELGFQPQVRYMNLSSVCFSNGYGTAVHELLHVLGIFHEQSRSDRDKWIKVEFSNIRPGKEINFKKVDPKTTSEFDLEYDYKSIMHYSKYAFAKDNKLPTITSLLPGKGFEMGQRRDLSQGDIKKIRVMYKCDQAQS